MFEIRTNGEALDLPAGFSMEIEDTNPVFNDRGSQSIPVTIPVTRRNRRLMGGVDRLDSGHDPNFPEQRVDVASGGYLRRGLMNVTEAGRSEGITFNIGFDNSTAYAKWRKKSLKDLDCLPTVYAGYGARAICYRMENIYKGVALLDFERDFAVFPVAIGKEEHGDDKTKRTFWEILNVPGTRNYMFEGPENVYRIIDGEVTSVKVPEGYCISPFLRVWRVIELVFEDMGLEIEENPFREDADLRRLVVLNNAADAICTGELKYSELMPDSTVEEFLNALWTRFGLVYNINFSSGRVSLKLLRDLLAEKSADDITGWMSDHEKICYGPRQYLKLSASTSLEGAVPATERWEDFIKNLDVTKVHLGWDVSNWIYKEGTGMWDDDDRNNYEDWEPDSGDDDYPEPEEPWDYEQDDDRYDEREDRDDRRDDDQYDDRNDEYPEEPWDYERDDDRERSHGLARENNDASTGGDTFLAYEYITGKWYKLDIGNNKVKASSSSFFCWDPQPEGLEALELSSQDECVPIGRVNVFNTGTGNFINALMPLYLAGSRHYHSYIVGSDSEDQEGVSTPLAFMMAFTVGEKTIGRLTPENEEGTRLCPDDGSVPTLTLYWQFRDGLFARFWKDYDEILRHGSRTVEMQARVPTAILPDLDLLKIYSLKGIRCMIDSINYSLPASRTIGTDIKLRTIQTQGDYDIETEQGIPDFSAGNRHIEWSLYKENYGMAIATPEWKREMIRVLRDEIGYESRIENGYEYDIRETGIVPTGIERCDLTWRNDPELPAPYLAPLYTGKYKARIYFDLYESRIVESGEGSYEPCDGVIGRFSGIAEYTVVLRGRLVAY